MKVIPLRYIHQSDEHQMPANILDLAFIYRHDFPLATELFVSPPEEFLKKLFNKLQIADLTSLEANEEKLKMFLAEYDLPEEISRESWQELSQTWLDQLKTKHLSGNTDTSLSFLPVLPKILVHAAGTIYFDKKNREAVIEVLEGSLNIETETELINLTQKIDHKMIPTRIFSWVLIDGFKIVDCQILTQELLREPSLETKKDYVSGKTTHNSKTVAKIFAIKEPNTLTLPENIDGFILPNILDTERRLFEISEYAASLHHKPLIYELNRETLDEKELFDILFLRTNKSLTNIQLLISDFKSHQQLQEVLVSIESIKVPKSHIWGGLFEIENILNLEKYQELGISQFVLDLDNLAFKLIGENHLVDKVSLSETLIKFLKSYQSSLFDHNIKLLLTGDLSRQEDIVNFFISARITFFATRAENVSSLRWDPLESTCRHASLSIL